MFKKIFEKIEKYDSIIIFGHLNPDCDCFGAQVGLKEIILAEFPNKKVYLAGTGVPYVFDLLYPVDIIEDNQFKGSLGVLVDANDLSRMEDSRIYNCADWVKIDHHIDTGTFKEGPFIVDTNANSACDIIAGLVMDHNLKITKLGATALLLGIVSDSARFQFVTNYPETFERCKFLVEKGGEIKKVYTKLSSTNEKTLRVKGYVLSHYKKSKKDNVLYIILDQKTLQRLRVSTNHASNLINMLANVEGYPIWASFAEYEDGKVRCELRSNGPAVQPIAVKIGGGGHAQASGASLPKLDLDYIEKIIDDLDDLVEAWRK